LIVLDEIHKYRPWKRWLKGEFDAPSTCSSSATTWRTSKDTESTSATFGTPPAAKWTSSSPTTRNRGSPSK
jgi:hypothetical protein